MLRSILLLGLVLAGGSAEAASGPFSCTASNGRVQIAVSGTYSGTRAVGNTSLVVRAGPVVRRLSFVPVSSSFLRNKRLQLSGRSGDGSGTITTQYAVGNTYTGTLRAMISGSAVNAPVRCTF